jgi:hypothetical protein
MTELEEIQQKFESGRLEPIKRDLDHFIRTHWEQIEAFRHEKSLKGQLLPDDVAIKFYVLRHRSINPESEIREQLEEIQREKWIRGVQLGRPPDEQEVAIEWTLKHSAGWRAHRVTTIIYCIDREKDRYVAIFREAAQAAGRREPA